MQEARQLTTDVALDLDRLSSEIATRTRELQGSGRAQLGSSSSSKTVDDIDADLEGAEGERVRLEQARDDLQRKQSRLK